MFELCPIFTCSCGKVLKKKKKKRESILEMFLREAPQKSEKEYGHP